MPTRYLKESITESDDIDKLSPFEETVFYRLIVIVDDFGRMDGRLNILRSRLFPLKSPKEMTEKHIDDALKALADVGLVQRYTVNGKPFLWLTGWFSHQKPRAIKSKYPGPDEAEEEQTDTVADTCQQMIADSDKILRNRNRNSNRNSIIEDCTMPAEADTVPEVPASPTVITLVLNTGEEYPITQAMVDQLAPIYPGVNIMAQLNAMKGWRIGNPAKRKTKRGIMAFVTNWLKREQDEASRNRPNGYKPQPKQYQAGPNGVDIQPGENPFRR